MRAAWVFALLFSLQAGAQLREDPKAFSIHPFVGQPGSTFIATVRGSNLAGARVASIGTAPLTISVEGIDVEPNGESSGADKGPKDLVKLRIEVAQEAKCGRYPIRLVTANGVSNVLPLDIVGDPVLIEPEAAQQGKKSDVAISKLPVVYTGRLAQRGEADYYSFHAEAGATLSFEVVSGFPQLASGGSAATVAKFDPALTIYERAGSWFDPDRVNRIAYNDEPEWVYGKPTDTRVVHRFAKAGEYVLRIEAFAGQGGPDYSYALKIGLEAPPPEAPSAGVGAWDERDWTRRLDATRLVQLAKRGGDDNNQPAVETYRAAPEPVSFKIPGTLEGALVQPGETHRARFHLDKPADIAIEIETPGAAPPYFNPILRLLNSAGQEVASNILAGKGACSGAMTKSAEAKTILALRDTGDYTLEIREATADLAGADFQYRVQVRPQVPHVGEVRIDTDTVNLRQGEGKVVRVEFDREEDYRGAVTVAADSLPSGVSAIAAGDYEPDKDPPPAIGKRERYTPRSERVVVVLTAGTDAPVSDQPKDLQLVVRPLVGGKTGEVLLEKNNPHDGACETVRIILAALLLTSAALPAARMVSLRTVPAEVTLKGAHSTQQFVAIAKYSDGAERDVTAEVEWRLSNPGLAKFTSLARVAPSADGSLTLSASLSGNQAKSTLKIEDAAITQPVTFRREIVTILTTRGCNNATCHGGVKGQGGFKLSADALYPADDYEWITKGGGYQVLTTEVKGERIPRIDTANPEKSLLLLKPTMSAPHGGGKRFGTDSEDYNTILDWIRNGAPYSGGDAVSEAKVARLEIYPSMAILPVEAEARLLVTAHFTDGHTEDYTHQARYTINDSEVASVSAHGVIGARRRGETSMLVRAAGKLSSIGVGVIGPPIQDYPRVARNNFIDEHVFEKLRKFQIVPSDLAGDPEFLRRVCLDLTGTLPPPQRVREFLASTDPRKREKVIDALIASPEYVDYWTFRFADLFRVSIFGNGLTPKWMQEYWEWIRNNIATNRPYDQVARERIAAEGYKPPSRHFLPYALVGSPADTMAEEVRVFMGRRLDCAQCHNHPYEGWSQDQFWGMAAFFSRMFRINQVVVDHPTNMDLGTKDVGGSMDLLHPRTKAVVKPAVLDNTPLTVTETSNPRRELAAWMTAHVYFAEAAVNRIWGYFFARGIVDPVDDFRSTNPPTHPELLAALAEDFKSHGYDLRHLMKTIVSSRAYQLSHEPNPTNREDVTNYSRSLARGLDAEVLLDAVVDVTGIPETFSTAITDGAAVGQAPAGTRAIQLRDPDTFFSRFLELYGRANRGAIPERNNKPNLSQSLHVLAGATYVDRLGQTNSRLATMLESGATDEAIFTEFYLAALSRRPGSDELAELKTILAQRSDREAGLREFLWALISSREFAENH